MHDAIAPCLTCAGHAVGGQESGVYYLLLSVHHIVQCYPVSHALSLYLKAEGSFLHSLLPFVHHVVQWHPVSHVLGMQSEAGGSEGSTGC